MQLLAESAGEEKEGGDRISHLKVRSEDHMFIVLAEKGN